MRRRPAAHRLQRIFAALLWVLASFAFVTRQQNMDMAMSMSVPVTDMATGAATSQAAPVAELPMTELDMARMDASAEQAGHGAAKPPAAQAHHQPASHDADAPPTPMQGGHAGHCPFCFTAAFALAAFSVEFLALERVQTAYQLAHTPATPRSLLGHKRARAPPLLG